MIYFLTYIAWIVYSILFGISDAYYWYSANSARYTVKDFKFKDLHPIFFWTRSLVGGIFSLFMCDGNYLLWLPIIICLGLTLPFFHNGFYYMTRNNINSKTYPKRFCDMTKTSISNINFTFFWRSISFIIGLSGIISIYFIW